METRDEHWLRRALALGAASRAAGGDPFGAVLVIGDEVVAESGDRSVELSDPTAHAELHVISAKAGQ